MDDATWSPGGAHPVVAVAAFGEGARYRDLGLLARGGMGEVRRVWDERLGIPVAMKILGWDLLDVPAARARFASEVAITASLQHPGIPAVYDQGVLPDGRPWFTITMVEGRTLADLFGAADAAPESRRRLVALVQRVADTVGYAHSRGVLHRDLKPANLMVGAFGEVRVMDWGVARAVAAPEATEGGVVGTPAYMAPEQARGARDLDATADVWSLGAVLHHALSGRPPLAGSPREVWQALVRGVTVPPLEDPDLPEDLRAICTRALSPRPADRHPDARALATALADWLDGALRRAEALAIVERARARVPAIVALRARIGVLRAEADTLLQAVAPGDRVEALHPGWARQDEADAAASELTLAETILTQELRAAVERAPDLAEAHALLADHYREALARAEAERDPHAITRNEVLLATHDRGRHAAFLRGHGALTLHTATPVHATLFRYVEEGRRLVPRFERELGVTPLVAVPVEKGAWLVTLTGPGGAVRYPVRIDRGAHWDGVPPGAADPHPIWIPGPGELGGEDVYVPAGWCVVGGDPFAADSLRRQEVWVDGFVMERFPVTVARYARFLEAALAAGEDLGPLTPVVPSWLVGGELLTFEGHRVDTAYPDLPVTGVTHFAAGRAARWLGGRLPNELEVEKAARGVDARVAPWGRQIEPRWSRVLGSVPSPAGLLPVGAIATDEGPYGVRDLSGNARTWCANWWSRTGPVRDGRVTDPETGTHRSVRGGFFGSPPATQRAATRFGSPPAPGLEAVGLRVVRSAPATPPCPPSSTSG